MLVGDVMTALTVEVGPSHTLRQAAARMAERSVGSAVVMDPDGEGPGIISERDVLRAVADGVDLDAARVGDHAMGLVVFATPRWSLDEAADAMGRGRFRHLVVLEGGEVVGIVSVRDIIHAWANERAASGRTATGAAAA
ncbi:MAG: cyclic nucleotide-binding/CBS domain-containing protein [Solirubrobacteraceae bacterium]